MLTTMKASIIGVRMSPLLVAVSPSAAWTKSGM